jgi:hypothetical protein
MKFPILLRVAALSLAAVLGSSVSASANPRPLPFTYQHEQLASGESEIEQFVDLTPTRAKDGTTGKPTWYGLTEFTTEYETGLTDRLELGLYVTLVPAASSDFYNSAPQAMEGNGIKQRLRWGLAPSGAWPVDVSLYGELSENEREFEIEGKVLLQRRFGIVRIIANLSAEHEIYYRGNAQDFVLNPSAGVTVEASPRIQPGLETWMQGEWPEVNPPHPRPFQLGPHVYVGPTLLWQISRIWWSNGVYLRVTDRDHTLQPSEGFGNVWFRTIIGIAL